MQLQVPLPLIFLSCYTFTVLPALSTLHQTHACSKSNTSAAKPMAFALSHTLAPTSGTISPKTSGECYSLFLQKPTQDISLLRIFQLNHIALHSHQSVQCVCVCVRACVRMSACVCACMCVCTSFLHNYAWTLVNKYIFIFLDNIFHLNVLYVCMLLQCFEP